MELAQKVEHLHVAVQSLELRVFEVEQQIGEVTELMTQQGMGGSASS